MFESDHNQRWQMCERPIGIVMASVLLVETGHPSFLVEGLLYVNNIRTAKIIIHLSDNSKEYAEAPLIAPPYGTQYRIVYGVTHYILSHHFAVA
ncbi:hypothetical protein KIN20_024650 [Parelaphostrongylus tenuis]|uniref:Uncharacterized protein n=1 Tax=Parelaphostrongylus tenuis TaxID=148309 RepID=A0AAD5NCX9_PARTN|nr:hypothetical protein KIN20_024650 [Parelaphostrongylus tenuis]